MRYGFEVKSVNLCSELLQDFFTFEKEYFFPLQQRTFQNCPVKHFPQPNQLKSKSLLDFIIGASLVRELL